ncbi:hypothetical protein HK405_009186 [Cladochytrium tenue]|nr:hypothetical protein HK405_009186 [Cladochytrium tenue]
MLPATADTVVRPPSCNGASTRDNKISSLLFPLTAPLSPVVMPPSPIENNVAVTYGALDVEAALADILLFNDALIPGSTSTTATVPASLLDFSFNIYTATGTPALLPVPSPRLATTQRLLATPATTPVPSPMLGTSSDGLIGDPNLTPGVDVGLLACPQLDLAENLTILQSALMRESMEQKFFDSLSADLELVSLSSLLGLNVGEIEAVSNLPMDFEPPIEPSTAIPDHNIIPFKVNRSGFPDMGCMNMMSEPLRPQFQADSSSLPDKVLLADLSALASEVFDDAQSLNFSEGLYPRLPSVESSLSCVDSRSATPALTVLETDDGDAMTDEGDATVLSGTRTAALAGCLRRADGTFQCRCGRGPFATRGGLRAHAKLHQVEGRPHECEQCGASFRRVQDLRRHTSSAHAVGAYACNGCGARFTRSDALRRHSRTYCGERPGAGRRRS